MKCLSCGKDDFVRMARKIEMQVGRVKVIDESTLGQVCSACGAFVLTHDELEGAELRAARVVLHDLQDFSGEELRFTRKALSLTQTELAAKLGCTKETICRWEKGALDLPSWIRPAMTGLVSDKTEAPLQNVSLQKKAS